MNPWLNLATWNGGDLLFLVVTLAITYMLVLGPVFNVFFHPLRSFPGPKLWAASSIPFTLMSLSGSAPMQILDLHKRYGEVVRVRPGELSFVNPGASKDLKCQKNATQNENGKDPAIFGFSILGQSIVGADRSTHARFRRALTPAFSSKSVLAQEPLIRSYIDLLIRRMHEQSAGGNKPLDLSNWFSYFTFDVIGDLSFGEPFDCLQSADYHPWVGNIIRAMQALMHVALIRLYIPPWINNSLPQILTTLPAHKRQGKLVREKVARRLALTTTRPDFIDAILNSGKDGNEQLSLPEIGANASILLVAGAETTATALTAAVYCLSSHPDTLALLTKEIRSCFITETEIDIVAVGQLKYLNAVLDETMRIYPPGPWAQPRKIRPEGDVIGGKFVPGGTTVGIWQWAVYHNPDNFTRPEKFIPERWLGDQRFRGDQKEAFQPFSIGPRDCIGRNLANAEMRLVLARLIWNFDLKLDAGSRTWMEDSEVYLLWKKPPLTVFLTPRKTY